MHVIRHHHVAHKLKSASVANLTERMNKDVTRRRVPEQRKAPVATERDETQMSVPVVAFEIRLHTGWTSKTHTQLGRGGHVHSTSEH